MAQEDLAATMSLAKERYLNSLAKEERSEIACSFAFFSRALPALGMPFLCIPVLANYGVLSSTELARTEEWRNPAGVFALMQMQLSESRPNSK